MYFQKPRRERNAEMTYVMSDLHGELDRHNATMDPIQFSIENHGLEFTDEKRVKKLWDLSGPTF